MLPEMCIRDRIYGFLGRNFKWMMKKSLRKIPFVGKACESAGHIFVDRSGPKKVLETIRQAKDSLKDGVSSVSYTHLIYTMQSANRVILLDDGEIESIGTPEELLERSEMYREIYYSQQIVI